MWYFAGNYLYKNKKFVIIGIGINVDRSPIIVNYPTAYVNFYTKKLTSLNLQ